MEGVASGVRPCIWWRAYACGMHMEGVASGARALRPGWSAGGVRAQEMRKTTTSTSDLWRACWTHSAPVYALQSGGTSCARVGVESDEHVDCSGGLGGTCLLAASLAELRGNCSSTASARVADWAGKMLISVLF